MWKAISKIILKYRLHLILFLLMITCLFGYKGQEARLSYTMAQLLPKDNQTSINYNNFINKYGNKNIFVISIQDDDLFDFKHLSALNHLTKDIQKIDGVENVSSLTNLKTLNFDHRLKKFSFKNIFPDLMIEQADADFFIKELNRQPIYKDYLTTSNSKITTLLISLNNEILQTPSRKELIDSIRNLVVKYENNFSAKARYSGLPYIRTEDSLMVKKEITIFILFALFITSLILFLFFRSYKATFSSMITVIIGVVFSFGTIAFLDYEISIFMALVPPLIIVIGIPNCIFLINKFHNEYRKTKNKEVALSIMIQKIGNITLLTNITTAAGFASFMFTNSKTLQEFGAIASLNIMIIFVLSLVIIPIYFSLSSPPKEKHTRHLEKKWLKYFVDFLVYLVKNKRTAIYLVTTFLLVIGIIGLVQVKTTGNLTDDLPKHQALYKDLKFLEKEFGGVIPLEVTVDTKKKQGLFKLQNLYKLDSLNNLLSSYKDFSKPISFVDFIKHANQAYHKGDPKYFKLPNQHQSMLFFSYLLRSFDDINSSESNALTDKFNQESRFSLRVADISTSKMDSIFKNLIPQINNIFPSDNFNVVVTGSTIVFLEGTKFLLKNLIFSLLIVIVLISFFMSWMFKSFRMVLISIIPNLIPLLITGAIMGYFDIALKPSTILVFSIAFGISVDDTIHFLAKYRQELVANNWCIKTSVFPALRETGVSMFYTSVVLFFGFFIFVASDFGGTIALGLLVSITLMIAMLSNLLLLPALLLSQEKKINYSQSIKSKL